ncbi:Ig-like domain-containing protein, partial [Kitasatospora sp. NPDC059571]|uniref:Ig-like domain-containing protein n=1 Tax=Kitasatospora sp. NPDC059571 TaxID=3346871 RepID=UPI0036B47634
HGLWAAPVLAGGSPGRGEYQGADPTLAFPAEAAAGDVYGLDVPVSTGGAPAVLAGWVDFDRNGRFDPTERVQAEIPAGAATARLEWPVPDRGVVPGETWARLRIARDAAPLVSSGGFADSGEVVDQRIRLAAGSARPEITGPVTGTVTADARPVVSGDGGAPGATVAVTADGAALCSDQPGRDGAWSCRPERPLGDGPHTLTAVETTRGGAEVRGEPVRLTVRTAPPAAPVLSLPEFTNDPGLLLTGVGEPGTTVSVAEPPGSGRVAGELCSTAVPADGSWSCLPVENLAEGAHRLTATAVDAAGNRTTGRPVPLTVDTVAPRGAARHSTPSPPSGGGPPPPTRRGRRRPAPRPPPPPPPPPPP